jgi:hypothetical protein
LGKGGTGHRNSVIRNAIDNGGLERHRSLLKASECGSLPQLGAIIHAINVRFAPKNAPLKISRSLVRPTSVRLCCSAVI